MPSLADLNKIVDRLAGELDKRTRRNRILDSYYEGGSPLPVAIVESKVTKAYRRLMPVADAPWGSLVVGSVLDRLQVGGIRDKSQAAADAVWRVWQQNHMDAESKLAHSAGLISGRAFALVWPDAQTDQPEISLDTVEQMVVEYEEGSRHKRRAALRRWVDSDADQTYATLYLPDGIYKLEQTTMTSGATAGAWQPRQVDGEQWPVPNPFGVVPVVEIRFNSRLKPGRFGHARGEYEHCLGLIDRINLLTFLGLVVAFWMGFPVRAVIGDRILRDDDGNVIPPFDVSADSIVQLENPQAKLDSFAAADRGSLSIYPELAQLAAITKTPRHYFPLAQAMSNLSADAVRADEGALNAKTTDHKGSVGEGWLEVLRLCGEQIDQPLSPAAEVWWVDRESRSLAEMADAAVKLATVLPWQALAERFLSATQDEIARWEAMRASDQFGKILAAAVNPAPGNNESEPAAAAAPAPEPTPAG